MGIERLNKAIDKCKRERGITSTRQMADLVGLHHNSLNLVRYGTAPGIKVVKALATIPELRPAIWQYIMGDVPMPEPQKPGLIRRLLGKG